MARNDDAQSVPVHHVPEQHQTAVQGHRLFVFDGYLPVRS
jgi:hypothetical protein